MYGRNSVLSLATPSGEGLNGADVKPSGRTIVHWDLLLTMQAQDGTLVIQEALEKVEGAEPRIVTDHGSRVYGERF